MALTFKEKIFYQDQAESSLETLNKENLSIREKVATQDRLTEALEKLDAGLEEPKAPASLYERLVNGEFNSLPWEQYFEKLKEACEEEAERRKAAGARGLEAHPMAIACIEVGKYLEAHYDPATDSMSKAA